MKENVVMSLMHTRETIYSGTEEGNLTIAKTLVLRNQTVLFERNILKDHTGDMEK
jgi:hypothetical protein